MNQRAGFVPSSTTVAAIAVLALTVGWTPSAEADITRIVITRVESPTFEGVSFGQVGPYEKLRLRAFGEVDPADPRNHVIADIDLAPRNTRGMVEYDMDVVILKPVTLTNGNRRLLYYMNNRGNLDSPFFPSVGVLSVFNDGSGGNDPTSAAHAGNGFLMRQGYTIVSSGWDPGVAAGGNRLTIRVPVAKNPDGSPVIGPSLEEFVIDNATTVIAPLTYPAAATDKSRASLTVRTRYDDSPVTIPAAGWEYVNALSIRLLPAGTPFTQGRLYEFTYPARDPLVAGLGFAATRDFAAFLRYVDSDETGTPNPLVGNIERVYTFGISQPARYMRDFLHLGFNEDEQGHRVFDGILNWLGGGSGIFLNYRFAQAARTHRQHIGRWYPEREFPFANRILFDPVTGRTDGRRRRCLETNTCPRIFEVNSANEYLGESRFAPAHGHAGERSSRFAGRPVLSAVEPSSQREDGTRPLSAAGKPSRSQPGPAGPSRCARCLGNRGEETAGQSSAATEQWDAGVLDTPGGSGLSLDPGGDIQRADDHRRPVRLRAVFRPGDSVEPPTDFPGLAISRLRSKSRRRWQRHRGHSPPGDRGSAGDLHRLVVACCRLCWRRPL